MVVLPRCPGYYLRHPAAYPGLPFAEGLQHPIEVVDLAIQDHEAGYLPLSRMPGALHDLVLARQVHGQRAAKVRAKQDEQRAPKPGTGVNAGRGRRAVHR